MSHGTHEGRNPRRVCWLSRRDSEVLPCLGAGYLYLYQRRWKAYWMTSAMATTWFALGVALGQDAEAADELQNQLIGLFGLVALAAGTAVEAGLAAKKAYSLD